MIDLNYRAINFDELVEVFARVHGVVPFRRTAFTGRLKNFIRLGIKLGDRGRAGRGCGARFEIEDVVRFGLALEFSQLGLAPHYVVEMLDEHDWSITAVLAVRDCPSKSFYVAALSGLHSLMREDEGLSKICVCSGPELRELLASLRSFHIIDLEAFHSHLFEALDRIPDVHVSKPQSERAPVARAASGWVQVRASA